MGLDEFWTLTPAELEQVEEASAWEWKQRRELSLLAGWASEWCRRQERLSGDPSKAFEGYLRATGDPGAKQEPQLELAPHDLRRLFIELTEAMGGTVGQPVDRNGCPASTSTSAST